MDSALEEREVVSLKDKINLLTVFKPISGHHSYFKFPENTRRSLVFWCLQEEQKRNIGQTWVKNRMSKITLGVR